MLLLISNFISHPSFKTVSLKNFKHTKEQQQKSLKPPIPPPLRKETKEKLKLKLTQNPTADIFQLTCMYLHIFLKKETHSSGLVEEHVVSN